MLAFTLNLRDATVVSSTSTNQNCKCASCKFWSTAEKLYLAVLEDAINIKEIQFNVKSDFHFPYKIK